MAAQNTQGTQDTGKFRNTKDQYYTKPTVAKKCVEVILATIPDATATQAAYQWIEPSAGNGVFLKALPAAQRDTLAIDIEPKAEGIQRGNFLEWIPLTQKRRIFFGNPPFGRQGSLAKAFIKHAATSGQAEIIAFILPRSFVKPSMSRAFPPRFHCLHTEELEKNAFEVNKEEYDVPCVFQIWVKRQTDRPAPAPSQPAGFSFVKYGEAFDIAFKRVGGLAGKCYPFTQPHEYNKQCFYFLKLDTEQTNQTQNIKNIMDRMNQHVFPSNTVGPRSLSKGEMTEVLNEIITSL